MSDSSFHFHGDGKEYFKIWISNLMLSIVTLGIYSAWAKVRTHRYFYGNTEYQGYRFDYLASPIAILKGRIIALIFMILYVVGGNLHPYIGIGFAIILFLVIPWIVSRSLRFNARVTQFRNVRFDFLGTAGGAAKVMLLWPLLGMLSLGLLMPMAQKKSTSYVFNNHRYGNLAFENKTGLKKFYGIFFKAIGLMLLIMLLAGAIVGGIIYGFGLQELPIMKDPKTIEYIFIGLFMPLFYIFIPVFVGAYQKAAYSNAIYAKTTLDDKHHFGADYKMGALVKLYFKYGALTLFTFGFAWPWFKVALAKYSAAHTQLNLDGDLDNVIDEIPTAASAAGDELGDAFDIGAGVL